MILGIISIIAYQLYINEGAGFEQLLKNIGSPSDLNTMINNYKP